MASSTGIGKMRNEEIGNGKYGNEEMSNQMLLPYFRITACCPS